MMKKVIFDEENKKNCSIADTPDDVKKSKEASLDPMRHKFKCKFCKISFASKKYYEAHRKTKEHKDKEYAEKYIKEMKGYIGRL